MITSLQFVLLLKRKFLTQTVVMKITNKKDKHGNLIINCNNSLHLTPNTPDDIKKFKTILFSLDIKIN